jgi:hypothetical protein
VGGTREYSLPFPDELAAVVATVGCWPGWSFRLEDVPLKGLCLIVAIDADDAYNPGERLTVTHYLPVPPASHNERCWARWVLEQILLVQRHEAMEAFTVAGERLFPPGHGGGEDPYYTIGQF